MAKFLIRSRAFFPLYPHHEAWVTKVTLFTCADIKNNRTTQVTERESGGPSLGRLNANSWSRFRRLRSDPRTWELATPSTLLCGSTHNQARRVGVSPHPRFDFTLSAVEPRSKIMFLSTSCQSGAKQTTNLKSRNISFKILPFFLRYFLKHLPKMNI